MLCCVAAVFGLGLVLGRRRLVCGVPVGDAAVVLVCVMLAHVSCVRIV